MTVQVQQASSTLTLPVEEDVFGFYLHNQKPLSISSPKITDMQGQL